MGAIGGGIWHGIKGARNSPRVSRRREEEEVRRHDTDFIYPFLLLACSAPLSITRSPTTIRHWH